MAGQKRNEKASTGIRSPGSYYEMRGEFYTWFISVETAERIGKQLDRRPRKRPRWIKFVDLHGARAWVRGDSIFHLTESTERQRFQEHEFEFMLGKEREAEDERLYTDCDSE